MRGDRQSAGDRRKEPLVADDERLERLLQAVEDAKTSAELRLAEGKLAAYKQATA